MRRHHMGKMMKHLSLFCTLLLAMIVFGCSGDKGDQGAPGVSTGTLAGTVKNSLTQTPVAGATITISPSIQGQAPITTDTNGNFRATLPLTVYTLTISAPNYTSQTATAAILAGQTTTENISLVPTANAVVTVAAVSNAVPGQSVTLTAVPAILDATNVTPTYQWTQVSGPPAVISNPTSATPTIVLGSRAAYKQTLAVAEAPRQSVDPATEVPVFSRLNRTQVLGLTNGALNTGLQATFQVTMTAGSDVVTAPATVTLKPMFVPQTGHRDVPVGQPLLLQGKSFSNIVFNSTVTPVPQASWNWTMSVPVGSSATLNDPTTINPDFTPDVVGVYTVTETVSGQRLVIYAGTWQGAITGLDANGDPTGNPSTSGTNPPTIAGPNAGIVGCPCHYVSSDGQFGKFTRAWNVSGHSHIVSGLTANPLEKIGPTLQNITDVNGHWTPAACGQCHTVGFSQYSSTIKANGFSEVYRAEGLTITKGPNAWINTVKNFPHSASLMQVQCENCHGPSASPAHTTVGTPASPAVGTDFFARVSFSSDVCGTCHGMPTSYPKWQEWRESGHGDFETAMFEGISNASATSLGGVNPSCGGCHTGQGFGYLNSQLKGGLASRTLTAANLADPELAAVNLDNVQPQVCVTCHSTHNAGVRSGLTGNVVNLQGYDETYGTTFAGNTPLLPAGFQANGVGRGALCIVCHESRNGEPVAGAGNPTLHETGDPNFDPTLPTTVIRSYGTPHEAAQGDVLMGRNAYFVVGTRSPHSLIANTCVNCHMDLMPAPSNLDPARLGTNHNFAVDIGVANICANCHQFSGQQIQDAFNSQFTSMLTSIANKIYYMKTYSLSGGAAPHMPSQDGATVTVNLTFSPSISVTGSSNAAANTTGTVSLGSYLTGITYKGVTYATGLVPVIYEAVWNAALVNNDASQGIHNPSFEQQVMQETQIRVSVF